MTAKNVLRGYSHELFVAEKLIEYSDGKAYVDDSLVQQKLLTNRKRHSEELLSSFPSDYKKITQLTEKHVAHLPQAYGSVKFTETSANGGEVYDVMYQDVSGDFVKVSCKLSKMEDKAYRFSSEDYILDKETDFLKMLFTQDDVSNGLTFAEALAQKDYTVGKMQSVLVNSIAESLLSKSDQTYDMFMKLLSDRFIGVGGFYKTLPNGGVLWYPENVVGKDTLHIVDESIVTTRTTVKFRVRLVDEFDVLKQLYDVSFRVKFKDGVRKPVRLSSSGYPTNVAATVKTVLVGE